MANILVVDDDKNISELYELELSEDGHNVTLASSGPEAISHIETHRPDLVVLDIAMPGMDGIETLSHLLEKYRAMPVILNSAYSQYRDNFMTWPANAYVVKSGDLTELKMKIQDLLGVFSK